MIYQSIIFFALPLLASITLKIGFSEYGWKMKSIRVWWKDFLFFYSLMFILIMAVFKMKSFQYTYPLFKPAERAFKYFVLWESIHLFYMLGWEFLWRGYLLGVFKKRAGPEIAVLVQLIPFAILHIGKPELEAYGSIIAGVFLGVFALKTNSFIPGAFLHFLVALTMDVFAILGK